MLTRTSTELLAALSEPQNEDAWREFDARYRPVVLSFLRRVGLSAEDASDVSQEAMVRFVKAYREGKYDRSRGRLASWIIGITKHCVDDLQARRRKAREQRGLSALIAWPDDHQVTLSWEAACERAVFREGLERLRRETRLEPSTLAVFELIVLEGRPASEVASTLGLTVNDVYVCKHRCLTRFRGLLKAVSEAYDSPFEIGS